MEKLKRLMDMTEHPERYTERDWQEVLDGEQITQEQTDAAWQEFEAKHFGGRQRPTGAARRAGAATRWGRAYKVAASFAGILLLSGIAMAAIITQRQRPAEAPGASMEIQATADRRPADSGEATVERQPRTVVFENAELQQIADSLADFYRLKPGFRRDAARHLRLYYEWDQHQPIGEIADMLNHFEQVSIRLKGDSIIIE